MTKVKGKQIIVQHLHQVENLVNRSQSKEWINKKETIHVTSTLSQHITTTVYRQTLTPKTLFGGMCPPPPAKGLRCVVALDSGAHPPPLFNWKEQCAKAD